MTARILVCFTVVLVSSQTAWGNSDAVLNAVANGFQFPKERLRINDVSNSEDAKKNPKIKAGYLIDTSDNTFAHVQFLVTEPGAVLTLGVEERFRNALAEQSKIPNSKPNVRTLNFGNNVEGYLGMLSFGPGGSTTGAVLRVPGKYDLRMTVTQDSENPLGAAPETEAYYEALKTNDDFFKDALARASQTIANEIVAGRLRFGEDETSPAAATPPPLATASMASPPATNVASPTSSPLPAQSVEQTPSPVPADFWSAHWLWWLGLAVVLFLGIVWLARKWV